MKKAKFLTLITTIALSLSLAAPAFASDGTYSDVPIDHWAYGDILRASSLGIVSGVGGDRFNPDGTVTNAEFATMVTRAFYPGVVDGYVKYFGEPETWWVPYVESAYAKCLLDGTEVLVPRNSGNYAWDDTVTKPISRYDMAQVMYNTIAEEETTMPTDAQISQAQSAIADWSAIPAEYQTAVATCFAAGLLSGTGNGNFSGDFDMTRGQAAAVLCRLVDYIAGNVAAE